MKILGIERDHFASNHYRILQPLLKMRELEMADTLTIKEQDFINNIDFVYQKVLETDIVVFQRPADEAWLNFIKVVRKAGKIVICDYDDDPFNTSPMNPAYRFLGIEEVAFKWPDGKTDMLWAEDMVGSKGEVGYFNIERNIKYRDLFMANFKKADMVTCTTPILQESFLKINPNVVVLPNLIDFDMYPQVECVKKEVRLMWQGGHSHYEDLFLVAEQIKKILKKHDNVKFIYAGDLHLRGLFKDVPEDKIEWHGWVAHTTYPYKLATLNADIGICPLIDNAFNKNKTAIKWMEYSVMGIATIASDIPPYSPVIENGKDGILVKDDQWLEALEDLINNKEKRVRLAKNAYDKVYEEHNADTSTFLWRDAYEKVLHKDLKEMVV